MFLHNIKIVANKCERPAHITRVAFHEIVTSLVLLKKWFYAVLREAVQ